MSGRHMGDLGAARRLLVAVPTATVPMPSQAAVALEPDDLCLEVLPARAVPALDLVDEQPVAPEASRLEPRLAFRLNESSGELGLAGTGAEAGLDPPTYDERRTPVAYDEARQVLHLRAYDDLAWVRLDRLAGRLEVLGADVIRPWLRFGPLTALETGDGLFSAASGNPALWSGPVFVDGRGA